MPAHILIIADGRSPTAQSWIKNIQVLGYQVSLLSTFPCDPPIDLADFHILPIAFSRFSSATATGLRESPKNRPKSWLRRFAPILQALRYHLGPLTLPRYARTYQGLVEKIQPDLIHALRIPFEGMLASYAPKQIPLIVSTWGNDLTLHAKGSPLMRRFTRRCLARADGLIADTYRDIHLAQKRGLRTDTPTIVLPGSGGLDLDGLQNEGAFNPDLYSIPNRGLWVVNPRGLRPGSVHQDVFFRAIPKILAQDSDMVFVCPNLAGIKRAEDWVTSLGIEASTYLLPKLSQTELWSLLNEAAIFVSPSSHDGTPNTLLEAMACGCFPIVGDIESLQEWITHGENGFLVDPRDPTALASAVLEAADQPELRQAAANQNRVIIEKRAAQSVTQPKIDAFYTQFLK